MQQGLAPASAEVWELLLHEARLMQQSSKLSNCRQKQQMKQGAHQPPQKLGNSCCVSSASLSALPLLFSCGSMYWWNVICSTHTLLSAALTRISVNDRGQFERAAIALQLRQHVLVEGDLHGSEYSTFRARPCQFSECKSEMRTSR